MTSSPTKRKPWGSRPRNDECTAPVEWQRTVNGYINHQCRCPGCRAAWAAYNRERRERKGSADT